jgi:hypothetical protein
MSKPSNNLSLLPVIGLVFSDEIEKAIGPLLRTKLRNYGIRSSHWRVIRRLDVLCNAHIAQLLAIPAQRPKILCVMEVLDRTGLDKETLSSLSVKNLRDIRKMVTSVPPERRGEDALVMIVREMLTKADVTHFDRLMFPEIMRWWSKKSGGQTIRSWKKLKESYLCSVSWSLPADIPDRVDSIKIESIASGKMLKTEGRRMGNCLASNSFDHYVYSAMFGLLRFFHLYDEYHPLICATLSVNWDGKSRCWGIEEFETVGRGKPQARFHKVAEAIVAICNTTGYQPQIDD